MILFSTCRKNWIGPLDSKPDIRTTFITYTTKRNKKERKKEKIASRTN